VFRRRPLDFMVLCSSITSVVGGAGQIGYCGANAFLDAFAGRRSRESDGLTVAINWGRWQGVGLARDFESWHQSRTGQELIGGMTGDEGFEALRRILYHGIGPRVAVMTDEWRPERPGVSAANAQAVNGTLHSRNGHANGHSPSAAGFSGNPTEKRLAGIWQQILGTSRFDRHTSFQELGGDSLVGIQMTIRIRELLGVQLPIHAVFDCPTIAALATRIEQETEEGSI
jgi:acyl carrier protein